MVNGGSGCWTESAYLTLQLVQFNESEDHICCNHDSLFTLNKQNTTYDTKMINQFSH